MDVSAVMYGGLGFADWVFDVQLAGNKG